MITEQKETPDSFVQLYEDVKKYVQLQSDYIRLEFVEKLTILLSTLIIIMLTVILLLGGLFYLCFSLAYLIGPVLGGIEYGFMVVSGLYFLLVALLFVFRKQWIINPMVRFLSGLFLKKQD